MGAAFLAAIIGRPDDNLPRQVYADALDAGDDPGTPADPPRAEFIRVQCRIASWFPQPCPGAPHGPPGSPPTPGCDCEQRTALRFREVALLKAHGARWLAGLLGCGEWRAVEGATYDIWEPAVPIAPDLERRVPGGAYRPSASVSWHRGFIGAVHLDARLWPRHGPALLATQPAADVVLGTLNDAGQSHIRRVVRGRLVAAAFAAQCEVAAVRVYREAHPGRVFCRRCLAGVVVTETGPRRRNGRGDLTVDAAVSCPLCGRADDIEDYSGAYQAGYELGAAREAAVLDRLLGLIRPSLD